MRERQRKLETGWLGRQDSNLGSRDQNPLPYRLATPQSLMFFAKTARALHMAGGLPSYQYRRAGATPGGRRPFVSLARCYPGPRMATACSARARGAPAALKAAPFTLAGFVARPGGCVYIRASSAKRSVAQPGSAPRSGRGGRRFKSCHSDHIFPPFFFATARGARR